MRLPRDVSGQALAQALKVLGYAVTRQTGSHMRARWYAGCNPGRCCWTFWVEPR